jgi:ribosomal protein S15P/S13E
MLDSPYERDLQLRKTVFKSVTGKMSDARSGFGRIKDAVGLRGHISKHSKDDTAEFEGRHSGSTFSPTSSTIFATAPDSPQTISKAFTWKNTPAEYQNGSPKTGDPVSNLVSSDQLGSSESPPGDLRASVPPESIAQEALQKDNEAAARWAEQVRDIRQTLVAANPSIAGSTYGDGDLEGPVLESNREPNNFQVLLHRRHSFAFASPHVGRRRNEVWYARRMSASEAEEAILSWEPIGAIDDHPDELDAWAALQRQKYLSDDLKHLFEKVVDIQDRVGPWTERKIDNVEALDEQAGRDQEGFGTLLYQLSASYQAVQQDSQDIIGDERSHMMEKLKDVDVLGAKLEYEINALVSKVQDVEDGVSQFEAQVIALEARAAELQTHLDTVMVTLASPFIHQDWKWTRYATAATVRG